MSAPAPCAVCGKPGEAADHFCDVCGAVLPAGPPEGVTVSLSGLDEGQWQRLRETVDHVRAQGFTRFAGELLWPETVESVLIQKMPADAVPLPKVLAEPDDALCPGWQFALVAELADAVDSLRRAGGRLNSLSWDGIFFDKKRSVFAGLVVPLCLTRADAPAAAVPAAGVNGRFAAPELQGYADWPLGPAVDVYLLGLWSYYLLTRGRPCDLLRCGFAPVSPDELGPAARQAFADALCVSPAGRPDSAARFVGQLRRALVRDAGRDGFTFLASANSDVGLGGRVNNEDAYAAWVREEHAGGTRHSLGAFAVADGMGGSQCGERASACAVEGFLDEAGDGLPTLAGCLSDATRFPRCCRDWLLRLNDTVRELGRQLGAADDVGTTFTALLFVGRRAVLLHAGDSRAYLFRRGALGRLTEDQTYARALEKLDRLSPEEAAAGRYKNVLTSFLGTDHCEPQVEALAAEAGDRFLLCSDGLLEGLTDEEIAATLGESDPRRAAWALVERCRDNLAQPRRDGEETAGAPQSDNLTAVVVEVGEVPPVHGQEQLQGDCHGSPTH
jgi:serine/threonine protein phosphatase PrpC